MSLAARLREFIAFASIPPGVSTMRSVRDHQLLSPARHRPVRRLAAMLALGLAMAFMTAIIGFCHRVGGNGVPSAVVPWAAFLK